MSRLIRHHPPRRQRGVSTLLIAMLMLAILTIITLFAARYGVSEQRTSANEYRYKMAFHVAETGLNRSLEYIKLNTATMMSTATGGWLNPGDMQWQPCSDATTMDPDPCLAEPDGTRRAGMYRYVGATNGVLPVAARMPKLDTAVNVDKVGDFVAGYQSYATLCRMDTTMPATPICSLAPTTGDSFYVTVVSRGTLTGENATATIKQSFGAFHLLGVPPAAPLIAAGIVNGLGNAQIIPNPDAGGAGIPVSVWSKRNVNIDDSGSGGTGSSATCQLGEWLASEAPTTAAETEDRLNGVCETCSCNKVDFGYGMISGHKGSIKKEGEDILDVDGDFSEATPKVLDSKYFPSDLFTYVFGVPGDDASRLQYLQSYATQITDCSALTPATGGLYWYTGGGTCSMGSAGTLQRPLVLVSDSAVRFSANSEFFGIVFVRKEAGTGDLFTANGGGQIYGSVILEGEAKLSGNPAIVYNKAVLANVRNSPDFVRYGPVAGSWSDSLQ